jgi:hypothetical protein
MANKATAITTCDRKALSKFADKVPMIKGASLADQVHRTKMCYVVDIMIKEPDWVSRLYDIASTVPLEQLDGARKAKTVLGVWAGNYDRTGQISEAWKTSHLLQRYGARKNPLSEGHLTAVAKDPQGIHKLWAFDTQCPHSAVHPAAANDKLVASKTYNRRADLVGSRVGMLIDNGGIAASGDIDYSSASYKVVFDDKTGLLKSVEHVFGKVGKIPARLFIDTEYKLKDLHLDGFARFVDGHNTHYLHNFFDDSLDFKKHIITQDSKKETKLKDIAKVFADAKNAIVVAEDTSLVVEKNTIQQKIKETQNKSALTKAQVALKRKAEEADAKRTVTFKRSATS